MEDEKGDTMVCKTPTSQRPTLALPSIPRGGEGRREKEERGKGRERRRRRRKPMFCSSQQLSCVNLQ